MPLAYNGAVSIFPRASHDQPDNDTERDSVIERHRQTRDTADAYPGRYLPERRQDFTDSPAFVDFCRRLDERMDSQDSLLSNQAAAIERVTLALFAKESNNEFESPGVMTVLQKINRHVDMMCNFASGVRRFGKFLVWLGAAATGVTATIAALNSTGIL